MTQAAAGDRPVAGRAGLIHRFAPERADRIGYLTLAIIALAAFLVRLVGVLAGGGLDGKFGFDDTVYFGASIAFVEGRLPYHDFNTLHPPGYFYLLSPFALIARATDETTAFAIARLGFMALGAVNTFLVGLVGRRLGWGTALCAAALYAAWIVPAQWERTTYLVAPQAMLLLLAMLALTGRGPANLTTRRVAGAAVCFGIAGVIQIWTAVPAAVVLAWLVVTCRSVPRTAVRLAVVYVATGAATALLLLAPFLVTTGQRMIELVIFAQAGRTGSFATGRVERLRLLEGVPTGRLGDLVPGVVVVGVFVVVVVLVAYVAWRRPPVRLWAAVVAAQTFFLMITPVFFPHYSGWTAPLATLCIGAVVAMGIERVPERRRTLAAVGYGAGLVVLVLVATRPAGQQPLLTAEQPNLEAARCVTADEPILLMWTHTLRRSLQNGCVLLPNPKSTYHVFSADRTGERLGRKNQPEYQALMRTYYASGDAALFNRLRKDALSEETIGAIRAELPFEEDVGGVLVLLRDEPGGSPQDD